MKSIVIRFKNDEDFKAVQEASKKQERSINSFIVIASKKEAKKTNVSSN